MSNVNPRKHYQIGHGKGQILEAKRRMSFQGGLSRLSASDFNADSSPVTLLLVRK